MKNKSAITLLILSLGLFYTFTNVEIARVKELHVLASQYQDVLANVSDIVRLRDSLLIAYEEFPTDEIERVEKVLPDNVDTVRLALELDGIASRYGITIKDVKIVDDKDRASQPMLLSASPNTFEKATVSFNFVSNYDDLKLLLSDIERNLRIMEIKSVSFRVDDSRIYEHAIIIETYWINKMSPSLTAASPLGADLITLKNELVRVALDREIFADSLFLNLSDFSSPIPAQPTGRSNPFDRLGGAANR